MKFRTLINRYLITCFLFFFTYSAAFSQTDFDGIFMSKNNLCAGAMYSHSSWTNYWEGTNKRDNANLGRVSSNMYSVMANYGITSRLNIIAGIPYVTTKASAGQLHPMQGVQDLSLWLKLSALEKTIGKGDLSLIAIGGFSKPLSNYAVDFLPLSIGSGSTNFSFRAMADYQLGDWFATASATYVRRSNVHTDKPAYYTTEMHFTNEIKMPNAFQYNARAGFRNGTWIIEGVLANWTTLGGFDISKNNMPFPSNKMNMTSLGVRVKKDNFFLDGLSLIGSVDHVVAGRNVGQANMYSAGIFYIVDFTRSHSSDSKN